ncbi:MAG: DUF4190 domain-containing protein, partial [Janthinobacterium lividum]
HDPYRTSSSAEPTQSVPHYAQPQPDQPASPWGSPSPTEASQDRQPSQGQPQGAHETQHHGAQPYGTVSGATSQGAFSQGAPGQGAQSYGSPAYGQFGQDYPEQVPVAGMAHAVLWTAVGGLVLLISGLGWIAAIVALALTPGARRDIVASQGRKRGLGFLLAGKICAWVTIGLSVLGLLAVIAFVIFGLNSDFNSDSGYYSDSVSALLSAR